MTGNDTLKGLSVLPCILGLSYPGVAHLLDNRWSRAPSTTTFKRRGGRPFNWASNRCVSKQQVPVLGIDFTHVKYLGYDKIVGMATAIVGRM